MAPKRRTNLYPHAEHGFRDVLRWQFGFGTNEGPEPGLGETPAYQPQFCPPEARPTGDPDPERIRLTWIGHSTFLIQHRGRNILTDPIWGHCGPVRFLRKLRRTAAPGLAFERLPEVHDVLISHSHYDHLDAPTIGRLGSGPNYWVPGGLAGWFRRRGMTRCQELEWWESKSMASGIELHCVPAQHFSGRTPFDRNRTHWCGWVIRSSTRSLYFAADTGYCPVFKEICARLGGFDLAMIPIGAYRPRWMMQAIHVDAREAVQIHLDTGSRQSVACHWGTFTLTDEPLGEPPRLLAKALAERSIPPERFRALKFGQTIEV